jgi:hypothetical protein
MMTATSLDGVLALCSSEAARDEELGHAAGAVLRESGYCCLRSLECRAEGGVVIVRGVVPSVYLKQRAQARLMKVASCRGVMSLVEVRGAA